MIESVNQIAGTDDPYLTLIKLANPTTKVSEEITTKEKGEFALKAQLDRTEYRISQMR